MRATVKLSLRSGASSFRGVCVCVCVWPRVAGCLGGPVLGAFRSSLHLAQEKSVAIVLQAVCEDLAAGLRHQQGVFELGWPLPVSGDCCPAVRPRFILPATCDITYRHIHDFVLQKNTLSLTLTHRITEVWGAFEDFNVFSWMITGSAIHITI